MLQGIMLFFSGGRMQSHLKSFLSIMGLMGCVASAAIHAEMTLSNGQLTGIESDSKEIISYKHQEHFWETEDGALHVTVQREGSMSLYSSFDEGNTWSEMLSTQAYERPDSSDGFFYNNAIYNTFATENGNVGVAKITYDPNRQRWTDLGRSNPVPLGSGVTASRPTIVGDQLGKWLWIATPTENRRTWKKLINLFYSPNDGVNWIDTGLRLGTSNFKNKAARIVALADRVGAVYSDVDGDYMVVKWAYRLNSWGASQAWSEQEIGRHPRKVYQDPVGTHYNVAVDSANNIHVVTSDGGNLLYFRYDSTNNTWQNSVTHEGSKTAYTQLSITQDGRVFVIYNSGKDIKVIEGNDQGEFTDYAYLTPPSGLGLNYYFPRLETPSLVRGNTLPILLQAAETGSNGAQVLLHFPVELD